jgi:hypothetical protein
MFRKLITSILFFSITLFVFGQHLSKNQKDSIRNVMNKIGEDDQKYRWQLMLGELDSIKLDSLKKLPDTVKWNRIKKVFNGEIVFKSADSIWKLQNKIDSINILKFVEIINKYGYPSYKRIRSSTSEYLSLHMASSKEFDLYIQIFKEQLLKGNMPPNEFATWYDRCQLSMKKKQLYGEYDKRNPCLEDLLFTNSERKKIGLKKLKSNNCN